jgi:predicted transcriptional regulator
MGEPKPIFDEDEAADIAADAEAIAEMEAGQGIPHETIKAWLLTWGQKAEASE